MDVKTLSKILERLPEEAEIDLEVVNGALLMRQQPSRNATTFTDIERAEIVTRRLKIADFGERLYKLMLRKSWAQTDLADATGLPRQAVSDFVRKVAIPEPAALLLMSKALDVDVEDMLPTIRAPELASRPPIEIQSSASDPTMAWVSIFRLVKVADLPLVLMALEEAGDY